RGMDLGCDLRETQFARHLTGEDLLGRLHLVSISQNGIRAVRPASHLPRFIGDRQYLVEQVESGLVGLQEVGRSPSQSPAQPLQANQRSGRERSMGKAKRRLGMILARWIPMADGGQQCTPRKGDRSTIIAARNWMA